jgi:hypothetical protein
MLHTKHSTARSSRHAQLLHIHVLTGHMQIIKPVISSLVLQDRLADDCVYLPLAKIQ